MENTGSSNKRRRKEKGRNTNIEVEISIQSTEDIITEHNYCVGKVHNSRYVDVDVPKSVNRESWTDGGRIIELGELLKNLRYCNFCGLGPVPLTYFNVIGELKKGLSGFLYVQCTNPECEEVNRVAYGQVHRNASNAGKSGSRRSGMSCFTVNTNLGSAMVDNGGPVKVNNILNTLNVPSISTTSLKSMERRAGEVNEMTTQQSTQHSVDDAFKQVMCDMALQGSEESGSAMCIVKTEPIEEEYSPSPSPNEEPDQPKSTKIKNKQTRTRKSRHTAGQNQGIESPASQTASMEKAKHGQKADKTCDKQKSCRTCKWWSSNRPRVAIPSHMCVDHHSGGARKVEDVSTEHGPPELQPGGNERAEEMDTAT